MQPVLPGRLHGLDALRAIALLLGIALHASMSYLPGAQYFWVASDGSESLLLAGLFHWIHGFRMPLFFLLAGYFARVLLQRRGVSGFMRDRGRRILMPLLVGWPILLAAIVMAIVWAAWLKHGGQLPAESPPGPRFTPDDFPLTHLWFLYMLVLLYAATLLVRGAVRLLDRSGRLPSLLDAGLLRVGVTAPLLLALPVAAALYAEPNWYAWFGLPSMDNSLYPSLPTGLSYGLAFAYGWFLQRQPQGLCDLSRQLPSSLLLAVIASSVTLGIGGLAPQLQPAAANGTTLLYAYAYALASWAWSLALIGLALRFLDRPSRTWRYLADASYWMYLVHLPLVIAAQGSAAAVDFAWWLEYPLQLLLVTALSLGSYQLLVRHSALGALLTGKQESRPTARAPATNVA